MSASQIGIYTVLINEMYERTEPLPLNYKVLSWQCGCSQIIFKKGLKTLQNDGKIIIKEGGLWNNRVEKEFKNRQIRSDRARVNALKGQKKVNEINGHDEPKGSQRGAKGVLIPDTICHIPEKKENPTGKRKSQLKGDEELSEHNSKLAKNYWKNKNWDRDVENQWDKFVSHHTAKGSLMINWDAAWKTWYCNEPYNRQASSTIKVGRQI